MRARRRRRLGGARFFLRPALLAVLASTQTGSAFAAAFTPGEAPATTTGAPEPAAAPPKDSVSYTLAPVRTWGVAAIDLRYRDVPGGGKSYGEMLSGTVNAASYIWQPWFMQVSGSLGLVAAYDRSDQTGRTSNLGGIGSLNLAAFPTSRFPFNVYADVNDSRASGQVTDIDFRSYRARISQSYSPEFSNQRYYGSYEYSRLKTINDGLVDASGVSTSQADDTLQVLRAGGSYGWGKQSVEGEVSVSRNRREEADVVQQTKLDFAHLRHLLSPSSALSVNTGLSYTKTAVDAPRSLNSGIVLPGVSAASDFTQLFSYATYRPTAGSWLHSESNPLWVTGTFRAFDFGNEVDGSGGRSSGATGSLGINYTLTPRAQLYSTTEAGVFGGDAEASSAASQTLGVTYTGEPIPWGRYLYGWSVGSSGTVGTVSGGVNDGTHYLAQANANHNLSRPLDLLPGSLVVGASQGLSYSHRSEGSGEGNLTTTLTAFWSSPANGTQAFAGLTLSDARRSGDFGGYFQLANAQANLQVLLSRWSTFSTGLTFQAFRSKDDRAEVNRPFDPFLDSIEGDWKVSYGVNALYTNVRAFGVPRLIYTGLLQANNFDLDSRAAGNLDGPLYKIDWSFENRLEYQIGRLTLLATLRWAEVRNGGTNVLAFVRAQRAFGAL